MTSIDAFPPGLVLILGAFLLPFLRGTLRNAWILLLPVFVTVLRVVSGHLPGTRSPLLVIPPPRNVVVAFSGAVRRPRERSPVAF